VPERLVGLRADLAFCRSGRLWHADLRSSSAGRSGQRAGCRGPSAPSFPGGSQRRRSCT